MRRIFRWLIFFALCMSPLASSPLGAATIAEVVAKIKPLNPQARLNYLVQGARGEGELVYYGTLPIDEFLPLARVFNGRYRSLALQHYFSPRDGILSRTLTEARAGRHAVDVVQVDLSYGYQLLNANLVQPYAIAGANQFYDGTYDPSGFWHSMNFGSHYLPTYVPELDGSVSEFYEKMFEQMEAMDRLNYDHIWVTEHHFAHYGGDLPHPPTFMSAIARTTQRIRLGVAINVVPLHNPIDVAESYAMVDVISNGRLDFGVGKGSEAHEYKKFGVDQKQATSRMYEGVQVMLQAWSDKAVSFSGEFYRYQNVPVFPKPVQRPHPRFWVGCARSEDSFRWAGENGFHLMTLPYLYREPQMLPNFIKAYRSALAAAGHAQHA